VRAVVEQLGLDVTVEIRGNEILDPKPALTFLWLGQAAMADGPAGPARIEDNVATFTPDRWTAEQRRYESENGLGQRPELWEGLSMTDLHAPSSMSGNTVRGPEIGLHVWLSARTPCASRTTGWSWARWGSTASPARGTTPTRSRGTR
jgi:hypothetical protein